MKTKLLAIAAATLFTINVGYGMQPTIDSISLDVENAVFAVPTNVTAKLATLQTAEMQTPANVAHIIIELLARAQIIIGEAHTAAGRLPEPADLTEAREAIGSTVATLVDLMESVGANIETFIMKNRRTIASPLTFVTQLITALAPIEENTATNRCLTRLIAKLTILKADLTPRVPAPVQEGVVVAPPPPSTALVRALTFSEGATQLSTRFASDLETKWKDSLRTLTEELKLAAEEKRPSLTELQEEVVAQEALLEQNKQAVAATFEAQLRRLAARTKSLGLRALEVEFTTLTAQLGERKVQAVADLEAFTARLNVLEEAKAAEAKTGAERARTGLGAMFKAAFGLNG